MTAPTNLGGSRLQLAAPALEPPTSYAAPVGRSIDLGVLLDQISLRDGAPPPNTKLEPLAPRLSVLLDQFLVPDMCGSDGAAAPPEASPPVDDPMPADPSLFGAMLKEISLRVEHPTTRSGGGAQARLLSTTPHLAPSLGEPRLLGAPRCSAGAWACSTTPLASPVASAVTVPAGPPPATSLLSVDALDGGCGPLHSQIDHPHPFVAGSRKTTGESGAQRKRPCKGKRDRIRRALALIESKIAQDPGVFDNGEFFLPPAVDCDARERARALARLAAARVHGAVSF